LYWLLCLERWQIYAARFNRKERNYSSVFFFLAYDKFLNINKLLDYLSAQENEKKGMLEDARNTLNS